MVCCCFGTGASSLQFALSKHCLLCGMWIYMNNGAFFVFVFTDISEIAFSLNSFLYGQLSVVTSFSASKT
jgi:hypothetical protein